MPDPRQLLQDAIATDHGELERWENILAAIRMLTSVRPSSEAERLLLAVLRFGGQLRLDPSSELPHSMSPEEMLKSMAVQALGHWTGLTYISAMQRVQATAVSPVLSGIVRTVIERARQPIEQGERIERIAEIRSEIVLRFRQIDCGNDCHIEVEEPVTSPEPVTRLVAREGGMTFMPGQRITKLPVDRVFGDAA